MFIIDQDLSHMDEDEAYDYKFVKWMIKEKVNISSFYYIGSNMFLKCFFLKMEIYILHRN